LPHRVPVYALVRMASDFSQARVLFERCLALDPAARDACLSMDHVAPALRARVEAMLRAAATAAPLLDEGARAAFRPVAATPAFALAPLRSDEFTVLRELGRGGMGAVYLARQARPQRLVALKRLGAGASAATVERFRLEADALARLQHPGIAAIHGVGRSEDGEPFLVMEYVDGELLAIVAATLPVPERLRLIAAIADAVEHAHARGVIHRDLKPANVLVARDGAPKVLDFGIARLVTDRDPDATPTQDGTVLGTPGYMSPEQAAGAEASPSSDVYALGAIGFELLAGRVPVPVRGLPPLLALRAIATGQAPPLSRLVPELRGDVESVFATALQIDPQARYPSAAAFADDVRRVLAHEPVRARPVSAARRARLWARRNPVVATSLAAAVFALGAGTVGATWFALGQRAERVRAEAALASAQAERERADSTLRFLAGLLAEANPARGGKPDVAVRDVLDRAVPRVLALPETLQAPLWLVLADTLAGFGANARITPLYERAVALAREHRGEREATAAQARLGGHLLEVGRVAEAREHLRSVLAQPELLDTRDRRRAMADLGRAEAQLGNEQATRELRDALQREPDPTLAAGEVPPELALALEELRVFADYGDGERLATTYADVMPRATAVLGPDHPFVLALERHEPLVRLYARDDAGSLAAAERSLARHRVVLGEAHPETLRAKAMLGTTHADQGNLLDAIRILEEARASARVALPESSALHLELLAQQVGARRLTGGLQALLEDGPDLHERFCSAESARHESCGMLALGLALAHIEPGATDDPAHWMAAADDFFSRRLGADHPLLASAYAAIATQHARGGNNEPGLDAARRGAAMLGKRKDLTARRYAAARMMLGYAFVQLERSDLALPLVRESHEVDAVAGWVPGASSACALAMALADTGRRDAGLDVLERAWASEMARPLQRQDRTDLARAFVNLLAGHEDHARYLHWARELRRLVDAGGGVPEHDLAARAALREVG
jgi:predicted Ser/Thr protein kinase